MALLKHVSKLDTAWRQEQALRRRPQTDANWPSERVCSTAWSTSLFDGRQSGAADGRIDGGGKGGRRHPNTRDHQHFQRKCRASHSRDPSEDGVRTHADQRRTTQTPHLTRVGMQSAIALAARDQATAHVVVTQPTADN